MERPVFPAHRRARLAAVEHDTGAGERLLERAGWAWRCPLEGMRVTAERDRPGIDQPDHLCFVEIDHRVQPFDRPPPDIVAARCSIEAAHPDKAPPSLGGIAEIASRKRRAEQ